jgi:uroporphyrinogen decarboxylase
MTGRQRVANVLSGERMDRPPILPILHTGLAGLFDIPLGQFFTRADVMAQVIVDGYRRFHCDGVQLTLGVIGEAEALGAAVEQPPDGSPALKEYLLADLANLDRLRPRDPVTGGRMPLFFEAVERVSQQIGEESFILATLRGPLLIASQLRGAENILVDMLEDPEAVSRMLEYTNDVAQKLARGLLTSGAHGLVLGEATCSPSFISPALYRELVLPHHRRLVAQIKQMGWRCVGLHVCGNTTAIIEDMISTGVDFLDVDYQVPAEKAVAIARGRMVLRGNLDPSSIFRFGAAHKVRMETAALCKSVAGARWIISSGCDIPPGTPAENVAACVETVRTTTTACEGARDG